MDAELFEILRRLRANAGDTVDIEAKAAVGGLPELTATICAFANLPGGGRIVLGLDERDGFRPSGLADVQALKQGLVGKARSIDPPVTLTFRQVNLDGNPVVIVTVSECPPSAKPAVVRSTGEAWLRGWDGDYRMSEVERQGFLSMREQPRADREPVPETSRADLDPRLTDIWHRTVEAFDASGLGRFPPEERLVRAGVVRADGLLSVAGLLALGVYPQQHMERLVINAAVLERSGARASQVRTITGPVPLMLEQALAWARSAFPHDVVADETGAVRDRPAYPLEAFRELISNALVHRDLHAWSQGRAIEVRLLPDRLVVHNPGGLYGVTVDRLGQPDVSSARNGRLVEICRYARTADDTRVVELLATGISTVRRTLAEAGLPAPEFSDSGIAFSVVLRQPKQGERSATDPSKAELTPVERALLSALGSQPATIHELLERTGRTAPALRKTLRRLREAGRVVQHGGRGLTTTYQSHSG